jgi:hypothetical protein
VHRDLKSTGSNELGLRKPGVQSIWLEWTAAEKHWVRWSRQVDLGVAAGIGVEMRLRLSQNDWCRKGEPICLVLLVISHPHFSPSSKSLAQCWAHGRCFKLAEYGFYTGGAPHLLPWIQAPLSRSKAVQWEWGWGSGQSLLGRCDPVPRDQEVRKLSPAIQRGFN